MISKSKSIGDFYFKSPAKLYFKYTAMNGGKSSTLLQIAHNYRVENKEQILVMKPAIDSKGDNRISTRLGDNIGIECDYLIKEGESITTFVKEKMISTFEEKEQQITAILVDESQFLNKTHVEELAYISNIIGIPTICFGLRTDFKGELFEGSKYLFALAQKIEELPTRPMGAIGNKSKKATMNLRMVNSIPVFNGEQVAIDDNAEIEYKPVTLYTHLKLRKEVDNFNFGVYNSFSMEDFLKEGEVKWIK